MTNAVAVVQTIAGVDTITCVGTTRTGSPTLTGGMNMLVTSAGQVAATLPALNAGASQVSVFNTTATAATVFPPVTGGTIQGGGADAAFSVATLKTATFVPTTGANWVVALSA